MRPLLSSLLLKIILSGLVTTSLTCTSAVSAGYRITQVKNGAAVVESYAYDNGGRVTNMTRSSVTRTFGYNSSDQLTAVTNGATWTTYSHDAQGRRTKSIDNTGAQRRFLAAGTPGTDLESFHLIADSTNGLKQGYVFAGDDPIFRYDGSSNRVYYLEDAMGSVIGLAPHSSPGTANTTKLFYDGFGKTRQTNGPAPTLPSGTGGDFRFHGAWWESTTDLYHMRAREYDQRMGRFMSRDPVDGDNKMAESWNPYVFASNNSHIYTDPSGEFTILGINISTAINGGLQAARVWAISAVRNKVYRHVGGAIGEQIVDLLGAYLPDDLNADKLKHIKGGNALDALGRDLMCEMLGDSFVRFQVGVRERDGRPVDNGFGCSDSRKGFRQRTGIRRPDLVFGYGEPVSETGEPAKMWLVGEFKIRRSTLVKYRTEPGQLDAILWYARNHTYPRTAIFITLTRGDKTDAKAARQYMRPESFKD